jgi:hypothetical protein
MKPLGFISDETLDGIDLILSLFPFKSSVASGVKDGIGNSINTYISIRAGFYKAKYEQRTMRSVHFRVICKKCVSTKFTDTLVHDISEDVYEYVKEGTDRVYVDNIITRFEVYD